MEFSLDAYVDELRQLVDVDCGTYSLDGIEQVVSVLVEKYQAFGQWDIKRVDCGKAGTGLEIRNKPEREDIDVLLVGHLDTVFPVGTVAERPLTTDSENAYGPGVADMKGGILNILYVMRNLVASGTADKLSICICMNPDEEVGSMDSEEWLASVAKHARCALVAEPARADGSLVRARKGVAIYNFSFKGKAVHAGNEPENGRSAVVEMAHWVVELSKLNNFETGTTLNSGVVSGGTGTNVVAENAKLSLDVRFWDNSEYDALHAKLLAMTEKSFTPDIEVSMSRQAHKSAMMTTEQSQQMIDKLNNIADELNIQIGWLAVGGGSDGNLIAGLGVPTIDGFGPIGANYHSDKEYLLLSSVEERIKLMTRFVEQLAN